MPRIGWVKTYEKNIPPILVKASGSNCVISKGADKWFISYKVAHTSESEIVIEDLNVSGMLKNHKLASAIADCGFYEF